MTRIPSLLTIVSANYFTKGAITRIACKKSMILQKLVHTQYFPIAKRKKHFVDKMSIFIGTMAFVLFSMGTNALLDSISLQFK